MQIRSAILILIIIWASLPYTLLLAGTTGCGLALALQNGRLCGYGLGGILFLFSDFVIGWNLFIGSLPHVNDIVWLTYGPAQMLIVNSVWSFRESQFSPR